jgi:hypothetical protein
MDMLVGVGVITASALLYWVARPKDGKETWLARLPGSWIALPLIILMGSLGGGMMIYTHLPK